MSVPLEARSYGEESSPEERNAIADRVSNITSDILLWREVPVPGLLSVELMERRVQELTQDLPAYARVVDLSSSALPDAKVRRRLNQMLAAEDRLQHLGVFTHKNALINVALKFVLSGTSDKFSVSVCRSYDEALEACRHSMQQK